MTKSKKKLLLYILLTAAALMALATAVWTWAVPTFRYSRGRALMEKNDYTGAAEIFADLGEYRDSKILLEQCEPEVLDAAEPGDSVYLGSYEQDNRTGNGAEAIEWLVLERQENHLLLISRYALDCQPFHDEFVEITWDSCSLREWLNGEFLNTTFTGEEQKLLSERENPAENEQSVTVSDRVFLLSGEEVETFFPDKLDRLCGATKYAREQGVYTGKLYAENGLEPCWWWLRSPGRYGDHAMGVYSDGSMPKGGDYVGNQTAGVRPAIWVTVG